jgi:FKBP12-rapamycin complex-associated protein
LCDTDELIDVDYDAHENAGKKVMRLANFLRYGLSTNDLTVMLPASKALGKLFSPQLLLCSILRILLLISALLFVFFPAGRLVRTEGTLTAECVEFEVKRALEWLQGERYEARRQAAVLVLKELAHNAPTLFNVHVASFFDSIWVALRDPKLLIREGAVEALRAALRVISERESRLRSQWYLKIYAEAQKVSLGSSSSSSFLLTLQFLLSTNLVAQLPQGFKSTAPEVIHGSLIAIGELLRNAGDFMMTRYKEVCDGVLKYKESKDRLVRRTVINLISLLASYSPDLFTKLYLGKYLFSFLSGCFAIPKPLTLSPLLHL